MYNPGTSTNSAYYTSADLIVTYESAYSSFSTSNLVISSSTPAAKQAVQGCVWGYAVQAEQRAETPIALVWYIESGEAVLA